VRSGSPIEGKKKRRKKRGGKQKPTRVLYTPLKLPWLATTKGTRGGGRKEGKKEEKGKVRGEKKNGFWNRSTAISSLFWPRPNPRIGAERETQAGGGRRGKKKKKEDRRSVIGKDFVILPIKAPFRRFRQRKIRGEKKEKRKGR